MYEIFGKEEAVTVQKSSNINKPPVGGSISLKGELNQKLRTTSIGSSKIILGDVSNKLKNTLTLDVPSNLLSVSPCKSFKKPLFSEELNFSGDRSIKASSILPTKREKSPKNVKSEYTPKPAAKRSAAKVSIFVDNFTDGLLQGSDPEFDEVFLPNNGAELALDTCESEGSPQKIYGYCEGYETPEEDSEGWLVGPLWNDKEELGRIIGLRQSPEAEPELPDREQFSIPDPRSDETEFDYLFAVDDPCIPSSPVDVTLADLEW